MRHAMRGVLPLATLVAASALGFNLLAQDRRSESEWTRRDAWQRPAEVMDALGLAPGSSVADIGAGRGYFTVRLAERVGPQGHVYAVDIDEGNLNRLKERADRDGLKQVVPVLSTTSDPKLAPESVNAILVVNAFHEMREFDPMLKAMLSALKPCGLLGIIDGDSPEGRNREEYYSHHEIPESLVRADAVRNGFHFAGKKPGFRSTDRENWYFLVFQKPADNCSAPPPGGQ